MLMKHLLCARPYGEHLTDISSFNVHNNAGRHVVVLLLFSDTILKKLISPNLAAIK